MKKIFTLLVMVALATCWVSCSDDDDNDDNANWQEIKATLEIAAPTKASDFYCYTSSGSNNNACETIIDWGDGTIDENKNTHYYSHKGTYYVIIKVKGLKKFTSSTQISVIDLSEITELTDLSLGYSSLNSLDLSKNVKLITLSCYNSSINSINLKSNTELNELSVQNNKQLTSLDLSNNPVWKKPSNSLKK